MALALEDSRMSMDSDLSNLSPCKPATSDNTTTASTTTTTNNSPSLVLPSEEHCLEEADSEACEPTSKDCDPDPKPEGSSEPPQRGTGRDWADIVEEGETPSQNSQDKKDELKECKSGSELVGSDSKMSVDDNSNSNISVRSNGSGRQIEIDFLDSANVEKYEKLIRDEKIKSPFKRRLSGGGEDDEADDGLAKFADAETNGDGTPQHKKSKTDESDQGREERPRRESSSSSGDGSSQSSRKPIEYEKDMAILERRQKQIDYGKNTLGYENYMKQVPRDQRTKDHPKTPPKHIKYSRRAWDGVVKVWRKQLHCFDPNGKPEADD